LVKKVRVYELARELGIENKEALDLCIALGIGVRSHSSSVEDPQADRVRRRAERDGIGIYAKSKSSSEEANASGPSTDAAQIESVAQVLTPESPVPLQSEKAETEAAANIKIVAAETTKSDNVSFTGEPPKDRPKLGDLVAQESARLSAEERLDTRPKDTPQAHRTPQGVQGAKRAPLRPSDVAARTREDGAPTSISGRPIPPPPGPPRSVTGRPIPPPPRPQPGYERPGSKAHGTPFDGDRTRRGQQGGASSQQGGYQGRSSGQGRPPFTGAQSGAPRDRQGFSGPPRGGAGGSDRSFGTRPGGAPGSRGPSGGAASAPMPPAGARGNARGARGKTKPSKRRSKKTFEELEPTQVTTYVPSSAPVPEGEIIIERGSTAQEVAPKFNRTPGDIVRFLLLQGELITATQSLSDDMVELFAAEIGARVKLVDPGQEQEAVLSAKYFDEDDTVDPSLLAERPPVVTVMGHVDHGKTKLLDRIREANVVAQEAGGITQHIGAYQVYLNDKAITFIDTPGHEAFTQMRARGAKVTDIVVLVVAADDGVMPQTVEAINHAKAADVPIVVAINKIDREDADPNRVMQQLSEYGLVPEAWGGDTITVQISALQNLGIDDLLEQILVLAEVLELKANPSGRATGVVLEANLDVGRGPVATVLIQGGTLHIGDPMVAGIAWGRVKALVNDKGKSIKIASLAMPVQVLGFSEVPSAGDEFNVTADLSTAKTIAESREQRIRMAGYASRAASATGAKLEDLFEQIQKGETATLNIILKADVQGSLEALAESLRKLERPEVKVSIIHKAVGGITENDVGLAAASNATIIGFNVRPDRRARELAEAQDVEIRTYEIIYKVIEDIESAVVGMLAPEYEEVVTGDAEVREVFRVPRVGAVAGCYVLSGTITRGSKVRFLRDGVVLWKGSIASLRRFKDDVREVQAGFECGIGLSDFQDLHAGDIIETYEDREIPRV
jgi:translation initiation factor IF-2